jgi:hypothetical protein
MVVRSALLTAEGLEELCHVLCCLLSAVLGVNRVK